MAQMYFTKTVQYNGGEFAPKVLFDVVDEDIDGLIEMGGVLIPNETKVDKKSTKGAKGKGDK